MKIWIINQYATLPSTGIGTRHCSIARELAARGHEVSIIAARWTHLTRDEAAARSTPQIAHFEGIRFVSLDLLRYRDAHDRKRVFNWFLFAVKVLSARRLLGEEPDVVIYSSPSLVGYLAAERIARQNRAKLIFEVRDIWPLTLTQIGGLSERNPLIRLFQWIEDRAYQKADLSISNLRGAVDHMVRRGLTAERFAWIPNGISLNEADGNERAPPSVHARIPIGKFVIGYTGTLGNANSMDTLIDAARLLRERADIVFALLGAGKDQAALEHRVRSDGLVNVIFLGSVPKGQVRDVLTRFDACWIGWKASPLYDYGIAANKIFDYLFAERPILHSFSGRHDPVREYNAGFSVPAEDPRALADAITAMQKLPIERRREFGANGRAAVLKLHNYGNLARILENCIMNIL